MKIKLALLLALITSAGLIAVDAPKPDAPKGDEPVKKGEGKKGDRKGPGKPESVSEDDWKKFLAANKVAAEDATVKAAEEKAKADPKDQDLRKAVMEARKAAILKADASLESVLKAIEESRGKGKKGKGDKGGKKPEGEGKKPEAK
jgi:hypothetical protein